MAHKRVVDGDGLWQSDKIQQLDESLRAEVAWLLPLMDAYGCFEANAKSIYHRCYGYSRTDWTPEKVQDLLDKLHEAGILFRWTEDGKTYGTFVGAHRTGRLPSRSNRRDDRASERPSTPPIPEGEFREFAGDVTYAQYRQWIETKRDGTSQLQPLPLPQPQVITSPPAASLPVEIISGESSPVEFSSEMSNLEKDMKERLRQNQERMFEGFPRKSGK